MQIGMGFLEGTGHSIEDLREISDFIGGDDRNLTTEISLGHGFGAFDKGFDRSREAHHQSVSDSRNQEHCKSADDQIHIPEAMNGGESLVGVHLHDQTQPVGQNESIRPEHFQPTTFLVLGNTVLAPKATLDSFGRDVTRQIRRIRATIKQWLSALIDDPEGAEIGMHLASKASPHF